MLQKRLGKQVNLFSVLGKNKFACSQGGTVISIRLDYLSVVKD